MKYFSIIPAALPDLQSGST